MSHRRLVIVDRAVKLLAVLITAGVVIFLFVPAVVVILLAFSDSAYYELPPKGWGLRQFRMLLSRPEWILSLVSSLRIASLAVVFAVATILPLILYLRRARASRVQGLQVVLLAPLVLPQSAYAVALYIVFSKIGLLGSWIGLAIAQGLLAIPLFIMVLSAEINRLSPQYEEAAETLGARSFQVWRDVTLPLLGPAIVAAAVLGFDSAFNDATFASFLSGIHVVTLPKRILDAVRFGSDPFVTGVAAFLVMLSIILGVGSSLLRRGR